MPDGVNELMPEDAWRVEKLRRQIMDSCYCWGYELVMPPLIEYLDSLLTGTGETLDLQTFKFIDQHNGRTLGIRADMTPQVARIDAHTLYREQPNRLFYTGSVLRARTDGAGSSRTPVQFGAEVFGHSGPESDIEIVQLMLNNVMLAGIEPSELLLDVGHVGIYRGLISKAGLSSDDQEALFTCLLRGSAPDVHELLSCSKADEEISSQIRALASLSGSSDVVLPKAMEILRNSGQEVLAALENLQSVIQAIQVTHPKLKIHVDLAELRGYRYHTGMLFALYDSTGVELSRGGRYDAIGEAFGRARPATGFSGDLVKLVQASSRLREANLQDAKGIWVDQPSTEELWLEITKLRQLGERVVQQLAGSTMDAQQSLCDRELVFVDGQWTVVPLSN